MNKANRDKIIVEFLNEAKATVGELGLQFGITRERVCQIYSKVTGQPRGTLKRVRQHHNEMAIKFVCQGCSAPVTIKDGLYLHKYCRSCHHISQTTNRIPKVTFTCTRCGKKYHPTSSSARRLIIQIGTFCSFQCYTDYGVKTGRKLGGKNKIKDAEEMGVERGVGFQTL
jgi:hypothetical protein